MENAIIFTDGAARGNPGPGGYAAIGIYDMDGEKKIFELGGADKMTTNNRMEMKAFIEALKFLEDKKIESRKILVCTDSSYLLNGVSKWMSGWATNGWKTKTGNDVLNQDLWQEVLSLIPHFEIEWKHIEGHAGIPGNERCDEIATGFADGENVSLYNGAAAHYSINLLEFKSGSAPTRAKSSAKAYSYVSMVDGKIETHQTWRECEARVKGKGGAKFRKSVSADDEAKIIEEFRR